MHEEGAQSPAVSLTLRLLLSLQMGRRNVGNAQQLSREVRGIFSHHIALWTSWPLAGFWILFTLQFICFSVDTG